MGEGANRVGLLVTGMSCQGCVRSVKAIIAKSLGIERDGVDVELDSGRAQFDFSGGPEGLEPALEKLDKQGFTAQIIER